MSSKAAPGEENITPGSPIRAGANGCVGLLVQTKFSYSGTLLHIGRSEFRHPPNTQAKVFQGMLGVWLAQAVSCGVNL